jgi:conjugal transfer pilin signal peptidase TrbI
MKGVFLKKLDVLYEHIKEKFPLYIWLLVAFVAFNRYYMFSINVSDSLPGTIFLIEKGKLPEKGDLVAFSYYNDRIYNRGTLFLKRVSGTPGSVVQAIDENGYKIYYVDGQFVGRAKHFSRNGIFLKDGPTGIIPEGHYYVSAPHPDSFDSRYALIGWISKEQIVGRAFKLF